MIVMPMDRVSGVTECYHSLSLIKVWEIVLFSPIRGVF